MIKGDFAPLIIGMTIYTGRFRIIFFIHCGFMDVLVTIDAILTDLPEGPFATFFMTGKTGCCQVCPGQLERAFVVSFYGKRGYFKSIQRVATGTIRCFTLDRELFSVVIRMATGAAVVFKLLGITRFMAKGTGYLPVLSLKGIVGARMVKTLYSLYLVKGYL